jgi:aspartyl-tRNA(Asn)/glutamyl-tRNA(Gln) amidotransferase subunit C
MSTTLTVADVERVAALAHVELTEDEKRIFTQQLAEILAYAEQVQAVNTTDVQATAHVNPHDAERGDDPRPCLSVEDALANAPDPAPAGGLFRVPRVIG